MASANVPFHECTTPRHLILPPATTLWRVTREPAVGGSSAVGGSAVGGSAGGGSAVGGPASANAASARPTFWPGSYEPSRSQPSRGGRFDPCRAHDYGYSYLALDDLTALAETLLRAVEFDGDRRPVLAAEIERRRLILLESRRELRLISLLSLQDLAAARQDPWLVQATPLEYSITRCWGHWLRECSPEADGMVWRSRCNPDGKVVLLFEDRCQDAIQQSALGFRELDRGPGLDWLECRLDMLQTYVVPADVDRHTVDAGVPDPKREASLP